nr:MgtC/SapB family protein [Flavobacterium sp.]
MGAGIIYKNESANRSSGLTTPATIWCTAGIGVAVDLICLSLQQFLLLQFIFFYITSLQMVCKMEK